MKDDIQTTLPRFRSMRLFIRALLFNFKELCMETPCWCPSEGHQHGGRKVTETSVITFNLLSKRKVITLEFRVHGLYKWTTCTSVVHIKKSYSSPHFLPLLPRAKMILTPWYSCDVIIFQNNSEFLVSSDVRNTLTVCNV